MRQAHRLRVLIDEKGLSFIEVLLSMVILMVVSLALMQTALVGFQENNKNLMRDEAVRIVEEEMNELRNKAFTHDDLKTDGTFSCPVITRNFRAVPVSYSPEREVRTINPDMKQVKVSVSWGVKGKTYNHSSTAIIRRPQ